MEYFALADDRKLPLALLLQKPGDRCNYTYDLGDNWEHELLLEDVSAMSTGNEVALLDGEGACPREDII